MKNFSSQLFIVSVFLLIAMPGCNSQDATKPTGFNTNTKATSAQFVEGKDYTLFDRIRVEDRVAFGSGVEAFSLLIPKGWKHDGEVIWTGPGSSCDGTLIRFSASSPDDKYSFDVFPGVSWSFSNNPLMAQFNQNNQSKYCGWGQPLDAENYVKQVFLPQEANNPQIKEMKANEPGAQSLQEKTEKYRTELLSRGASQVMFYPSAVSTTVKWNDDSEGIVLCGIVIGEVVMPNQYNGTYEKMYVTSALQKVLFRYPATEKEKAEKMLSVIMSSVRTNLAWENTVSNFWKQVREQKHITSINKIRMMDEYTRSIGENAIRKGNERLAAIDNNMRNWEAKQASQDRMHTSFIKGIREVETYSDASGVYEMSGSYNHAWSRGDGSSFIMTDNVNFDPSSVYQDQNWKPMQRTNP